MLIICVCPAKYIHLTCHLNLAPNDATRTATATRCSILAPVEYSFWHIRDRSCNMTERSRFHSTCNYWWIFYLNPSRDQDDRMFGKGDSDWTITMDIMIKRSRCPCNDSDETNTNPKVIKRSRCKYRRGHNESMWKEVIYYRRTLDGVNHLIERDDDHLPHYHFITIQSAGKDVHILSLRGPIKVGFSSGKTR